LTDLPILFYKDSSCGGSAVRALKHEKENTDFPLWKTAKCGIVVLLKERSAMKKTKGKVGRVTRLA
jgi:hypothetical protein